MKHKVRRRKKLRFARFFAYTMLWVIAFMFFSNAEISITYNKAKVIKATRTFWRKVWDRTVMVARGVGDIRYAIWR